MKTGILFPGQGSQRLRMLPDLVRHPAVDETLSEVSAVLDLDVRTLDTPEGLQSAVSVQLVHSDGRSRHRKSTSTARVCTAGCRWYVGRSILGGSCRRFDISLGCCASGAFEGGANGADVSGWIWPVCDCWTH